MGPKFKVGDKVHIVEELDNDMPFGVASEMCDFQGKEVTIIDIAPSSIITKEYFEIYDGYDYRIEEDGQHWSWSSPMFKESYSDKIVCKYKIGDKVKIKEDLHRGHDYRVYCNSIMAETAGKKAIIREYAGSGYRLDVDNGYVYTEDMLEDPQPESFSTKTVSLNDFLKYD